MGNGVEDRWSGRFGDVKLQFLDSAVELKYVNLFLGAFCVAVEGSAVLDYLL